jgi:hypothetical protein
VRQLAEKTSGFMGTGNFSGRCASYRCGRENGRFYRP